jgi:hypothetical protein
MHRPGGAGRARGSFRLGLLRAARLLIACIHTLRLGSETCAYRHSPVSSATVSSHVTLSSHEPRVDCRAWRAAHAARGAGGTTSFALREPPVPSRDLWPKVPASGAS